jgi:putative transposase
MVCSLRAHLVLTPKYRRGPFTGEILARCGEIMREVCADFGADFGAELREFSVGAGHVHLLGHCPPKVALSRLAGSLKGVSARRLRQEFPGHLRTYLPGGHFLVPVVFRRVRRWRSPRDHQGIHRTAEATRLDLDRRDSSRARRPGVPRITC